MRGSNFCPRAQGERISLPALGCALLVATVAELEPWVPSTDHMEMLGETAGTAAPCLLPNPVDACLYHLHLKESSVLTRKVKILRMRRE